MRCVLTSGTLEMDCDTTFLLQSKEENFVKYNLKNS